MISLVGWIIIAVTFAAISMGLLFPCYRIARRHFPDSKKVRWTYCGASAVCAMALWVLIPVIVHSLFPRF